MAPSASIFASWASKPSREGSGGAQRAALFVDPLGDLSKGNSAVRDTFAAVAARLEARSVEITRFDGKSATPAAWLEAARGCDFVVYFGHGIALRGHQGRALAFSDGSDGIAPITAEHIYRTANLSTFTAQTLFVFASCSTGLLTSGGWDSDRELHGLSAAHLYAGGGAVIAASRPLLGAPTLIFLGMLVDRMLSGFDAAKSLATVQRDFAIAQSPYAHPHFWGYIGLMGLPGLRIAISATRVAQIDAEP
jgi:hypothetical protein